MHTYTAFIKYNTSTNYNKSGIRREHFKHITIRAFS